VPGSQPRARAASLLDASVEPGTLEVLAHRPGVCGVVEAGNPAAKGQ
jgi:hypothetical protein